MSAATNTTAATAAATTHDHNDPLKPCFDIIFEICSPLVNDSGVNAPDLPIERWETAWLDLDQLHRQAEVDHGSPFHGRRYLIHSCFVGEFTIDYILERVPSNTGWNPSIAIYHTEKEESPYPYTEEWYPPQSINDYDVESLIALPGQCYNCSVPSQRICYECGVGICDTCAPHSGMCPYCVMEHAF